MHLLEFACIWCIVLAHVMHLLCYQPNGCGSSLIMKILMWTWHHVLLCMQDMTYSKQLEQYEDAVMQKRLEEMPETERARLFEEVESERARSRKS